MGKMGLKDLIGNKNAMDNPDILEEKMDNANKIKRIREILGEKK
jgi:hypothetical protein